MISFVLLSIVRSQWICHKVKSQLLRPEFSQMLKVDRKLKLGKKSSADGQENRRVSEAKILKATGLEWFSILLQCKALSKSKH